jgi:hypothetical protein
MFRQTFSGTGNSCQGQKTSRTREESLSVAVYEKRPDGQAEQQNAAEYKAESELGLRCQDLRYGAFVAEEYPNKTHGVKNKKDKPEPAHEHKQGADNDDEKDFP